MIKNEIKITRNEYLQGDHDNLYGTILGFKRKRRIIDSFRGEGFFSFFILFDHTTGRIERFLVNDGSTIKIKLKKR
jgi:hypothetical protein